MRKIFVPGTPLNIFKLNQIWLRPILHELDVQGFEKRVLDGGRLFLENVDYLLFECSYGRLNDGGPFI